MFLTNPDSLPFKNNVLRNILVKGPEQSEVTLVHLENAKCCRKYR